MVLRAPGSRAQNGNPMIGSIQHGSRSITKRNAGNSMRSTRSQTHVGSSMTHFPMPGGKFTPTHRAPSRAMMAGDPLADCGPSFLRKVRERDFGRFPMPAHGSSSHGSWLGRKTQGNFAGTLRRWSGPDATSRLPGHELARPLVAELSTASRRSASIAPGTVLPRSGDRPHLKAEPLFGAPPVVVSSDAWPHRSLAC